MESTIPISDIDRVLANIMPYDMVPHALAAFYASYRTLPGTWDIRHITLNHLFDTLDTFTRGNFQRGPIFDRLSGCLAGMGFADFPVLHAHAQAVLMRV